LREAYSALQIVCHWTISVLCVLAFPTAGAIRKLHMGHVFGIRGSTLDQIMARTHEWGGWLVLVLTMLLLFGRLRGKTPPLPTGMSTWQRWAAYGAHFAIYAGLFALVASGATAMYDAGKLGSLHVTLTKLGIGLIGIHAAAVLWHQFVRRDRLLWRMWRRD
jgi:cytochrome b561